MSGKTELIMIGGSAGSLDIIFQLLPHIDPCLAAAIVIILHRKNSVNSSLSQVMQSKTRLIVKEVEEKDEIIPRCIYFAPQDYHVLIERNKTFSLDRSEKVNYSRPAIDPTFETAAEAYGPHLAAILLSGANNDGVRGLLSVKRHEGITAVQDPATASSPYMPQKAIIANAVDYVLLPAEIPRFINMLAQKGSKKLL